MAAAPLQEAIVCCTTLGARRRDLPRHRHEHALVAGALRRWPPPCDVVLDTFGEDNIAGDPARRLYESFGFVPGEDLPDGPQSGSRQRFRLRRR
jgi:hypothetical protein